MPMSGDVFTGRRNSCFEAVGNAPARIIDNSATRAETIATNALVLSTFLATVAFLLSSPRETGGQHRQHPTREGAQLQHMCVISLLGARRGYYSC